MVGAGAVLAVVQRALRTRISSREMSRAAWGVGTDVLHALAAMLRPRTKV